MFRVSGSTIAITRGDTGIFTLALNDSKGAPYDFSNDEVLFTVKKTVQDTEALIQKRIIYGENVTILPVDTSQLPYGSYVYDIQVTTAGGIVDTVITPSPFVVKEEVTF